MQTYRDLLTRAQGVSNTPYNPYGGELVAGINPQQSMGISNINQYAGFASPYMQTALGYAQDAAQPITQEQIQQYMSPYTQNVVQATQNQFNNQNAQQQEGVNANAIRQGALGGNRVGIARAAMANQQQLAQAPVIASLMNQGYSTGLSTALAEQQARAAGAYSVGNLGVAGQNAGLTGANAQIGAGSLQQGTQQAQDLARYQQFMQQQAYPFQTAQWLAGLSTGVGSQMGGTGTTTGPAPNPWNQIMGGAAMLGGFFLDRGGRVVNRANGGEVPDGVANYDFGGTVAPSGGGSMGAMPYGGGQGWVPGVGITPGRGAPPPPSIAGQKQPDLASQMKNIGALGNALHKGMFSSSLGDDGLGDTNDPNWSGGEALLGSTDIGMGGIGSAARGGHIGFAEGGDPTFDESFNGFSPGNSAGDVGIDGNGPSPLDSASYSAGPIDAPPTAPAPKGIAPSPELSPTALAKPSPDVPTQEASAVGVAPAAADQRNVPRGIRNNNPGNIEDGSFARSQSGYVGSDGRFARYETPEAGAAAASNLLKSYSSKGINTISGIVNRWAPAADNNNTGAYIAAVSRATGFAPNQPLDMNDPNVSTKVSQAIFAHENGTPGGLGTLVARNYNRTAGFSPASAQSESLEGATELSAQTKQPGQSGSPPFGISNLLNLSPVTKQALVAAGFGMMSSRSPFAGVAIGEGGMEGLGTYQALKQQEAARSMKQSEIDLRAKQLAQQADRYAKEHELKMMPYQGKLPAHEEAQMAVEKAKLAETTRQHDLALRTPVKYGETRAGIPLMALPRPGPNGVEFYPIDPKTGQLAPSPLGGGLGTPAGGAAAPGAAGFRPAGFTQVADPAEKAIVEGPPVELRAAQPPASAQARNEDYLMEIAKDAPQYAADIKAIANYKMSPAQFSLRNNRRERAMGDVMLYDPTYDQRRYNQTNRAITGWAQSPEGRATRSLSVVIEHLGTAEELGKALDNGNMQALNSLKNTIKNQFGYDAPPNFETAKLIVADEIAKAVIGGQNAEADRQGLQKQLTQASSPSQLTGVVHTFKELMAGQVIGLKHTYETATGLSNFDEWLTPRTRLEVSKLMADRDAKLRGTTVGTSPAAPAGGGTPMLSASDKQALDWANANANDPRAAAIKKKLGVP